MLGRREWSYNVVVCCQDWTVNTPRGTSLLMTAAHELGHSLGLSHSDKRSALMAPFYRGYEENIQLDRDDIEGIQTLYGDGEDENDVGIGKTSNDKKLILYQGNIQC